MNLYEDIIEIVDPPYLGKSAALRKNASLSVSQTKEEFSISRSGTKGIQASKEPQSRNNNQTPGILE